MQRRRSSREFLWVEPKTTSFSFSATTMTTASERFGSAKPSTMRGRVGWTESNGNRKLLTITLTGIYLDPRKRSYAIARTLEARLIRSGVPRACRLPPDRP